MPSSRRRQFFSDRQSRFKQLQTYKKIDQKAPYLEEKTCKNGIPSSIIKIKAKFRKKTGVRK
jgi:hypothetical protein